MTIALLAAVLFCWIISIIRILVNSVSSDILTIQQLRNRHKSKGRRRNIPTFSILIPAYNEELTIERTLESALTNQYPKSKVEIIVVNDGSIDGTREVVKRFQREHKDGFKIRLINRPNMGKARALNYAIKHCAKGRLIVCLDADTTLNRFALANATHYFRDRDTVALSCYADIIEDGTILGLAQRIEYIIGYRIKSGHTQLGANYIIPGTGSVFRRSILKRVRYYESNTLTEDLDLTMKIMANKRKNERIDYARDVVAYTEAVHSLSALFIQRYRWTYGRAQVFAKHINLFFSTKPGHDKRLTWGTLPFTLLQDISFLLSPVVNALFIYLALVHANASIISSGIIILTIYLTLSIWSVQHISVL